jgi:hypothetical protein
VTLPVSSSKPVGGTGTVKPLLLTMGDDGRCTSSIDLNPLFGLEAQKDTCTPDDLAATQAAAQAEAAAATGEPITPEQLAQLEQANKRRAENTCKKQDSSANCGDLVQGIIDSPLYKDLNLAQKARFWMGMNIGYTKNAMNENVFGALNRIMTNYRCSGCSRGIARLEFVGGDVGQGGFLPPAPDMVGQFMNGVQVVGSNLMTFFGIAAGAVATAATGAAAVLSAPVTAPIALGAIVAAGIIGATIGIGVNGGFAGMFDQSASNKARQVAGLYSAFPVAAAGSPDPNDPCGPDSAYGKAMRGDGYSKQLQQMRRYSDEQVSKSAESSTRNAK